jgi:glutaminyl-peptide cyclotransferase
MDSQGRARLIVGGMSFAAVLLVITLLFTQQNEPVPPAIESPLVGGAANAPIAEADAVQAESPLTASISASTPADRALAVTDTGAVSTLTVTEAVSVTARSTVTVTLAAARPVLYDYEVVATFPHDPNAFTQGLQYVDGDLYEGTGLNGQSTLRRVELTSGSVEQQISIPEQYFGEGITVLEDRIYQLTWKSQVAFLYDRASFEQVGQFSYPTEGWGLTYDGEDLLMSDGSATIFRRDPATFAEEGRFTVLDSGVPVNRLNELEYIEGELWANVWQTDEIVIIDPGSGEVTGRVDFSGLLPAEDAAGADVLNGIAYDDEHDRIFVTGKLWPTLFEVQIVRRDPS